MVPPLRVLLLSPVASLDPMNGDVTYTEQLLACPPPGVEYVPYDRALADGSLVERFRRTPNDSALMAIRHERHRLRFLREALVNKARQRGWLFKERFRHFEVQPGRYDLVHMHVFSSSLGKDHPPVVISNSVPIDVLYRDGLEFGARRVRILARLDRWLAIRTGVVHSAFSPEAANAVVCFSQHLKTWFEERCHSSSPPPFVVVPPGLQAASSSMSPGKDERFCVGFIGHWRAKGGDVVLEAHRQLRAEGLDIELVVVGSEPQLDPAESARLKVSWQPRLPREVLLKQVIPSLAAFAYPSRFDGLPLTLLEVMATGVPVIVSDYRALPEVVAFGDAGMVVPTNDPVALAARIRELYSDPALRERLGAAGGRRVAQRYDLQTTSAALGAVYRSVAGASP